jgi:hypothetical protein
MSRTRIASSEVNFFEGDFSPWSEQRARKPLVMTLSSIQGGSGLNSFSQNPHCLQGDVEKLGRAEAG